MNLGTATILRADARSLPLADDTVDLVVTSPPYFALRSYQDGGEHYSGQIGSEPTPAEFVDALLEVTRECVRVLKPSGSLWVNLGDKYATGSTPGPQSANMTMTGGAHKGVSNVVSRKVQDGVRAKSLIGIPWRYALRCIDDLGLILRAEVIWSKPNGLPESVTDRVRRSHEQWFHFTLNPRYYSAVDEIRERHLSEPGREGKGALGGQKSLRPVGPNSGDYNPLGKLPGSVWTDDSGESLTRSVLSAVAAGALTIDEGERILWTGSTSFGQRLTKVTPSIAGDGSVSTTVTATDATGKPEKAIDERTDSSTKSRSDQSLHHSPLTTSAATAGASTLRTLNQSPSESTADGDHDPSAAQQGTPTTSRTLTSDAMASESAADAWLTEPELLDDAPPSVWQIATEPLKVPDHLGIDHFAAFPTEWPRRIIQGWSPSGVCVECGEGRRPVIARHHERPAGDWNPDRNVENRPVSLARPSSEVTVDGYACACSEPTADTTPAVVLDPFGGAGTTAMVAKALGRHGISVDMSADYCRLAEWRTNDRDQLAKVLGIEKAEQQPDDQLTLFGGGAA